MSKINGGLTYKKKVKIMEGIKYIDKMLRNLENKTKIKRKCPYLCLKCITLYIIILCTTLYCKYILYMHIVNQYILIFSVNCSTMTTVW